MHSDTFPNNTRSNFRTFIDPKNLSYIPGGDIEIAIKSITFDNTREGSTYKNNETLGLRSNLTPFKISSFGWDNIIALFTPEEKGLCTFDFQNPTFFPSSLHAVANTQFEIINIETGETPNFSTGSPTFIQVVVRSAGDRMKPPFHILLDSSCEGSLSRHSGNTNTHFVTQLPQRMHFRKDWMVCLKSIHMTAEIFNIKDCWIRVGAKKYELLDGYLSSISALLNSLNVATVGVMKFFLSNVSGKIKMEIAEAEKVIDTNVNELNESEVYPIIEVTLSEPAERVIRDTGGGDVVMSDNLKSILGYSSQHHSWQMGKSYRAEDTPDIDRLQAKHFLICCDLVEPSILGGNHVQILKYFPYQHSPKSSVIDFNFFNNDYVKLDLRHFDRIEIRIADITGETVQCNPDFPTRCQLLFVNTNTH